jgi:hypothetical protein
MSGNTGMAGGAGIDRDERERQRRIGLLVDRLPPRVARAVRWLLRPEARWVRIPAGVLFLLGSMLFILPVFGLWMLPLGVLLLAEDIPPLRRQTGRWLATIERRWPHLMHRT